MIRGILNGTVASGMTTKTTWGNTLRMYGMYLTIAKRAGLLTN